MVLTKPAVLGSNRDSKFSLLRQENHSKIGFKK